jgi:hypothetical protein
MARAVIMIDQFGDAILKTPFKAKFVADLKDEIPAHGRAWRPETKTWWIESLFVDDAIDLCREHYGEVEILDEREAKRSAPPPPPPPDPPQPSGPYATLHLLPTAPMPIVEVVYRKMAAMHHPDLGGDLRFMQQINAAFDSIRKLRNV